MKLIVYYIISIIILAISLAGVHRLNIKSGLPFGYRSTDRGIAVTNAYDKINRGEIIASADNHKIFSEFQLEYLFDSRPIGDTVVLKLQGTGAPERSETVELVPYYDSKLFIIISMITGIFFLLTAVLVVTKRPGDSSATALYWVLITFGLAIITSPGNFHPKDDWAGFLIRVSHTISYPLGSIFFLHFTFIFPVVNKLYRKILFILLYAPAVIIGLMLVYSQYQAFRDIYSQWFFVYEAMWQAAQLLLLLSIAGGALNLALSYRRLKTKEERSKVEWTFWGIAAGVSPFLIFFVLASVLENVFPGLDFHYIKEEYLLVFLILVPVSFAIAVVKYHVLNIELIIKRSIVYSVLLVLISSLYFGIIYILSLMAMRIIGTDTVFLNILAVFATALLFNPIRLRVKRFIDSVFYREKYYFDKAIGKITNKLKECITLGELGKLITEEIDSLIPVEAAALVMRTQDNERLRVLGQKNFAGLSRNIFALRIKKLISDFTLPLALENKVDRDTSIDTSMEKVFKRWDINIVLPLVIESKEAIGAIILGSKLSGLKYSVSDVELLKTIASYAALAMKRLELQEKLLQEEIEITKLEELNKLKSYFVASVSHDLKTPLTSIKMFAELLKNENLSREKALDYLTILDGETDRLGRLINNVLDFAKIERGSKEYNFADMELAGLVKNVLASMEYQFRIHGFQTETSFSQKNIIIWADGDAVTEALINILSNSIKYSKENKYIFVSVAESGNNAVIKVKDSGVGIAKENLENIFNPFFRLGDENTRDIKGAGIGLAVVKHIMDAHKGRIEVASEQGEGSTFSLIFPLRNKG